MFKKRFIIYVFKMYLNEVYQFALHIHIKCLFVWCIWKSSEGKLVCRRGNFVRIWTLVESSSRKVRNGRPDFGGWKMRENLIVCNWNSVLGWPKVRNSNWLSCPTTVIANSEKKPPPLFRRKFAHTCRYFWSEWKYSKCLDSRYYRTRTGFKLVYRVNSLHIQMLKFRIHVFYIYVRIRTAKWVTFFIYYSKNNGRNVRRSVFIPNDCVEEKYCAFVLSRQIKYIPISSWLISMRVGGVFLFLFILITLGKF